MSGKKSGQSTDINSEFFFFVMLQKVRARKDSAQAASPAGHDPAAEALAAEAQGQPVPV